MKGIRTLHIGVALSCLIVGCATPEPPDAAAGEPDMSARADLATAPPEDMSPMLDAALTVDMSPDMPAEDMSPMLDADAPFEPDQGLTPSVEPGAPPAGDLALRIGTGRTGYEPLLQADTIRWEAGPQGGHHIWVSAQVDTSWIEGLGDDARRRLRTAYTITHEDGTLLAQTTRLGAWRLRDDAWTHVGQYAVLEVRRRPSLMDGEWLHVRVELTNEEQTLGSDVWLVSECCD